MDRRIARISTGAALATGIELIKNPHQGLASLADQADIVEMKVGPKTVYLVNSPKDVKSLSNQDAKLAKSAADTRIFRGIIGTNVFTLPGGQEWRTRRVLEQPAFHRAMLETYVPTILRRTSEMFDGWERNAGNGVFTIDDLRKNFADLTLQITAETFFGQDISLQQSGRLAEAAGTLIGFFSNCVRYAGIPWHLRGLPTPYNRDFKKAQSTLGQFIDRAVEATDETKGKTLISRLKQAHLANPADFTRSDLSHEGLAFLLGSYMTTSDSLTWSIYELGTQGQAFLPQLRSEADRVLTSNPQYSDLRTMDFTFAAFKENLRLHPPAWLFTRVATEEITLPDDIKIKKGSTVAVSPYLMHRKPDYWQNPDSFDPTRFLDGKSLEPGLYIPFGFGPRACIGSAFAMLEAPLMMSMLAQRYDFKPQNEVTPAFHAVMRVKEKLQVQLARR